MYIVPVIVSAVVSNSYHKTQVLLDIRAPCNTKLDSQYRRWTDFVDLCVIVCAPYLLKTLVAVNYVPCVSTAGCAASFIEHKMEFLRTYNSVK